MYGGLALVALVLIRLMRPWRLPDQASRELSAIAAAVMLGLAVSTLVPARLDQTNRQRRRPRRRPDEHEIAAYQQQKIFTWGDLSARDRDDRPWSL